MFLLATRRIQQAPRVRGLPTANVNSEACSSSSNTNSSCSTTINSSSNGSRASCMGLSLFHYKRQRPLQTAAATRRRSFSTLAAVAAAQQYTRMYDEAFLPRRLRKIKVFSSHPPDSLPQYYHEKLNRANSNPRSIIKLYRKYIRLDDEPDYSWLVRCFCQLANVFGFNSFWAPRDKQLIHSLPTFKFLVYDLIERKEQIQRWRPATACNMALCLALLGVADASEKETQGNSPLVVPPPLAPFLDACGCTAFDKAGLAFALAITNQYDLGQSSTNSSAPPIALFLQSACKQLSKETLAHSGWVQYYLYLTLYLADVEQPQAANAIKRSIPFEFQESLHLRWLDGILLNGQPQGSEELQTDVDAALKRQNVAPLLNCSVGREYDEQHCLFAGHLLKEKNLALEYDYLMPLGPGRPKPSGLVSCKERIFAKFGINVAVIHRCFWDSLSMEQKDVQLTRLLAQFPNVCTPQSTEPPSYTEDKNLRFLRHKRRTFETWPPEKIEI